MAVDGKERVLVLNVSPAVDCGRFPIKRVSGDRVAVEADLIADGHDVVRGRLRWRKMPRGPWNDVPLVPLANDRYSGEFEVGSPGVYEYVVEGYIDGFASWRQRFDQKRELNQDIPRELARCAQLVGDRRSLYKKRRGLPRTLVGDLNRLEEIQAILASPADVSESAAVAASDELMALMDRVPGPRFAGKSAALRVQVDRSRALTGAWYEFFPRSCPGRSGDYGTLKECEAFLNYVADLGFDVVYLPPIHPIGTQHRKGANNRISAGPDDPGSPWAIGSGAGGHTALDPHLGTLDDFDHFHHRVGELGMELAMDVTLQCSPDHPWVKEHPSWFSHFPDGSIQYAENPPKKYEDVYPLNFETEDWAALWEGLWEVILFWAERGVRIFRVDNPHTKPIPFWEWLITRTQAQYPDAIFLSEAFTRPKLMYALSKAGFSQSYTYFAWRNSAADLRTYLMELTGTEVKEFFRPNFWPNTPDILAEYLQTGKPAAFAIRFVLAATLAASYGIYGPAFELLEHVPITPGSEEYDHSEKYEVRTWDLHQTPNIQDLIRKVNRIRHHETALQNNNSLVFHRIDNPQLLVYSKRGPEPSSALLMVVNMDQTFTQAGWTALDLQALGLPPEGAYWVHDLLTDVRYHWSGPYNYVELHPQGYNAHIFRIETEEGI